MIHFFKKYKIFLHFKWSIIAFGLTYQNQSIAKSLTPQLVTPNVLVATQEIIAGRVFESDDGVRLSFSNLVSLGRHGFQMQVATCDNFQKCKISWEIIKDKIMQEFVDGKVVGNYVLSLEEPFHVLRIRPLTCNDPSFISRECLIKSDDHSHLCYVKAKSDDGVYVTVFKEVPKI